MLLIIALHCDYCLAGVFANDGIVELQKCSANDAFP